MKFIVALLFCVAWTGAVRCCPSDLKAVGLGLERLKADIASLRMDVNAAFSQTVMVMEVAEAAAATHRQTVDHKVKELMEELLKVRSASKDGVLGTMGHRMTLLEKDVKDVKGLANVASMLAATAAATASSYVAMYQLERVNCVAETLKEVERFEELTKVTNMANVASMLAATAAATASSSVAMYQLERVNCVAESLKEVRRFEELAKVTNMANAAMAMAATAAATASSYVAMYQLERVNCVAESLKEVRRFEEFDKVSSVAAHALFEASEVMKGMNELEGSLEDLRRGVVREVMITGLQGLEKGIKGVSLDDSQGCSTSEKFQESISQLVKDLEAHKRLFNLKDVSEEKDSTM